MGKEVKKSGLAGIPAWGLSLMTFFVSIVLIFILNDESASEIPGYSSTEIIKTIFYSIVIAVACFFICKTHPKSVWYTPIICNSFGIIAIIIAIITPHHFTTAEPWIFWGSSFLLSIIGSIVGTMIGQRIINQAK
jgi:cell division protein FtsW (lipid II flippase)